MDVGFYAREYQAKTDDELLKLSQESDQLEPEAREQLRQEVEARGIGTEGESRESAAAGIDAGHPSSGLSRVSRLFPLLRRFVAKLEEWRKFRNRTGHWPALSIMFYILHGTFLFGWAGFLLWFGLTHQWTRMRFVLVFAVVLLVDAVAENWLERKIWLGELREHRRS